ncbi:MAG: hypothetical protein QOI63_1103, partial [Thermoplasmata archaeon]|nr:hypothetical protein [Thermoplasmata archaeon]
MKPTMLDLPTRSDERGYLTYLEGER